MSGSINRRRLLVLGAAAAAGACLGLPQGLLAQPSGPVQAGSLADYPKDGLYFVGAATHPGAGMPGVICSAKVLDDLIPPAR